MAQQEEQALQRMDHSEAMGTSSSGHLLAVRERLQSARQMLHAIEMQAQQVEALNGAQPPIAFHTTPAGPELGRPGLVLVHYLDEAEPAALVLQRNVCAVGEKSRSLTQCPGRCAP